MPRIITVNTLTSVIQKKISKFSYWSNQFSIMKKATHWKSRSKNHLYSIIPEKFALSEDKSSTQSENPIFQSEKENNHQVILKQSPHRVHAWFWGHNPWVGISLSSRFWYIATLSTAFVIESCVNETSLSENLLKTFAAIFSPLKHENYLSILKLV